VHATPLDSVPPCAGGALGVVDRGIDAVWACAVAAVKARATTIAPTPGRRTRHAVPAWTPAPNATIHPLMCVRMSSPVGLTFLASPVGESRQHGGQVVMPELGRELRRGPATLVAHMHVGAALQEHGHDGRVMPERRLH